MSKASTFTGIVLAFAAASAATAAQNNQKVSFGVAGHAEKNKISVAEVRAGSTAYLMGVRAGDKITHAGGKKVDSTTRMTAFVDGLKVGDPLELTIVRKGQTLQLKGRAIAR